MKEKIKKIFPITIFIALFLEYSNDYFRYISQSAVFHFIRNSQDRTLGNIIADYHVVEKGLTMPETRLGFGKQKIEKLVKHCVDYQKKYDVHQPQFRQAIAVLSEYVDFHKKHKHKLDDDLVNKIKSLIQSINIKSSEQVKTTEKEYFKDVNASFDIFSSSRRSVRNYSDENIKNSEIISAVEIASKAPSSCNRQISRVHIFEDKETIQKILEIQGGNRGFGHLANRLLIVTADVAYCHGVYERNMAHVDGGIFAMNLLNGLHFNKIIACPLNCYFSRWKDKKLRELISMKKSEVFVVMISCGKAKENFDVALSYRTPIENIVTFS
jgi:nitroreductase